MMIALRAGALYRSRFVDHGAPARTRQRDCCGVSCGTRTNDPKLFVVDVAAHSPLVVQVESPCRRGADAPYLSRVIPN